MEEKKNRKGFIFAILFLILLAALLAMGRFLYGIRSNPFTIAENQSNILDPYTYNETTGHVFSFDKGENAVGDISYELINAKDENGKEVDYFVLLSASDSKVSVKAGTPAGTYSLYFKVKADGNDRYGTVTKNVKYLFTVDKAENSLTEPKAIEDLVYTGEPLELVSAGECLYGTLYYRINDGEWSTEIPKATDAGIYTVSYKVEGDLNHKDIKESSLMVIIARKASGYKPGGYSYGSMGSLIDLSKIFNHKGSIIETHSLVNRPGSYVEYTYDGSVHDNGYETPEGIAMVGINKAVDAGIYIAIYTPKANYRWSDGSLLPVRVTMVIKRKDVGAMPQSTTVTYDGQVHTNGYNKPEGVIMVGHDKGKNAGTYTAIYTPDFNHCWSDGTISPVSVDLVIEKAVADVEFEFADLTYNGLPQKLIKSASSPKGTMLVYSLNNKLFYPFIPYGKNAGTYTVYYKVIGDESYSSDTRTVDVSISRKKLAIPTCESHYVYNGFIRYADVDNYRVVLMKDTEDSVWSARNVGEYTIGIDLRNPSNYEWEDGNDGRITLSWSIEKAQAPFITRPRALEGIVYNGQSQKLIKEGSSLAGTIVYKIGEEGTYTSSIPEAVNAGDYDIYYKVISDSDDYYDSSEEKLTVTINKAEIFIEEYPEGIDIVGDGNDHELVRKGVSSFGEFEYSLDKQNWSKDVPVASAIGRYDIYVRILGDENHLDYMPEEPLIANIISEGSSSFIVKPKALTLTYNGQAQDLVSAGEASGGKVVYKLAEESEYSQKIPQMIDAGTYMVNAKVEGDEYHSDSSEITIRAEINKASLNVVSAEDQEYVYDGTAHGKPVDIVKLDGNKPDIVYRVGRSGEYSDIVPQYTAATQTKTIYYIANDDNYETVKGSYKLTVNKADINVDIKPETLTYNGERQPLIKPAVIEGGTITYSTERFAFYSEDIPTGRNAGEHDVYYKVEGDENHNDVPVNKVTTLIKEAEMIINVPDHPYVYNGTVQGDPIEVKTLGNITPIILYGDREGVYLSIFAPGIINVKDSKTVYYMVSASNHKTVTGSYLLSVIKADGQMNKPVAIEGLTYNEKPQKLIEAGSSSTGKMEYALDNQETYSESIPVATDAGVYKVYYRSIGDDNHNDVLCDEPLTVKIDKALTGVTVKPQSIGSVDYDGTSKKLVSAGESKDGVFEYRLENGDWSKEIPTAVNAGEYVVYSRVKGDENHADMILDPVTAVINKVAPVIDKEPEIIENLTYSGEEIELIKAGTSDDGKFLYKVGDSEDWSEDVPRATDAGTYKISYKIKGDENHTGLDNESVILAVIANAEIRVIDDDSQIYTYNGEPQGEGVNAVTIDGKPVQIEYGTNKGSYTSNEVPLLTDVSSKTIYYKASAENHNAYEGSYELSISKADAGFVKVPEALDLRYTGESQPLLDEGISNDGMIKYSADGESYSEQIPEAIKEGIYDLYYKVDGDSNHNDLEPVRIKAEIKKALIEVYAPDQIYTYGENPLEMPNPMLMGAFKASGSYGKPIEEVGSIDTAMDIPYSVEYDDPIRQDEAGVYTVNYRITAEHHETYEGSYDIIIRKADGLIEEEAVGATGLVYNGQSQQLLTSQAYSSTGTVLYSLDGENYSEDLPGVTDAGTYTIYYYAKGDHNHLDSEVKAVTVTIDKAQAYYVQEPLAYEGLRFNGSYQPLVESGSATGGQIVYNVNGEYIGSDLPYGINAADYQIEYWIECDDNHYIEDSYNQFVVSIDKVNTFITSAPILIDGLKYNGEPQGLIVPAICNLDSRAGSVVEYSVNGDVYSNALPMAVEPGVYDIYLRIAENDNYFGIEETYLGTVIIEQPEELEYNYEVEWASYNDAETIIELADAVEAQGNVSYRIINVSDGENDIQEDYFYLEGSKLHARQGIKAGFYNVDVEIAIDDYGGYDLVKVVLNFKWEVIDMPVEYETAEDYELILPESENEIIIPEVKQDDDSDNEINQGSDQETGGE